MGGGGPEKDMQRKEACRWTRQRCYRPIDQDSCGIGLGQEADLGSSLREIVFQVNKRVESRGKEEDGGDRS